MIDNVGNAFKCQIIDPQRHRIATISDGFPHYIHRFPHGFLQMFLDLDCAQPQRQLTTVRPSSSQFGASSNISARHKNKRS